MAAKPRSTASILRWLSTKRPARLRALAGEVGSKVERDYARASRFRRLVRGDERLAQTVARLHFVAFALGWFIEQSGYSLEVHNTL